MFCKIIKENKKNQILRGIQLGIAMQLTNICRDIEEDLNMNRIYFPKTMRSFREEKQKIILKNKYIKNSISNDLPKLLDNAELIYNNAWDGIYNLKIRYAIPVAIAAELYKRIGYKIRNKNCDIWNKRIYLNIFEKIFFSIVAVLKLFFKKKRLILDKEIDHIIVNELIRLNVEL